MSFRISVDTGGTFTDVIVTDADGKLVLGKALTTPHRSFEGFSASVASAAAQLGLPVEALLKDTSVLIYGTTRATNAIVEQKVAKTAFLVTEGFPDILVYRQGGKLNATQLNIDLPPPYVPRRLTWQIPERVDAAGEVLMPIDVEALDRILHEIKAKGVEAIAVCLLWSIVNSTHELAVGKRIAEILPGVPFTLSHQLNPIIREYPRASSTAIDASLKPLMQEHLSALKQDLAEAGFTGELLVSTSFGGVMHIEDVIAKPSYMVMSGPAMAPLAGLAYAESEKLGNDIIVVDAGGTTFDVSLVRQGMVKYTRETWFGEQYVGHNLGMSTVDVRSVGAGGGSIAWIDSGGLFRVGPKSAGSVPGPACYSRGGTSPTVTDAAVVLGYLDPDYFLAGRMKLDVGAAEAIVGQIAEQIGKSLHETATSILTLSTENMIGAIQSITVNDGVNPRDSILVAGGGAAGLNILPIAQTLGCDRVLLPRTAGALSACGAQLSDIVVEFPGSCFLSTADFDMDKANALLSSLQAQLEDFRERLAARGIQRFHRSFFVEARYSGQQFEIEVPVPVERFETDANIEALVVAFNDIHERLYGVRDVHSAVECVNWKARLRAELTKPPLASATAEAARSTPAPAKHRACYFTETGMTRVPVYYGNQLTPGDHIDGPAIIEEATTTIVVYPKTSARVTLRDNYILTPVSGLRGLDNGDC